MEINKNEIKTLKQIKMAENIKARLRVKAMYFAAPITAKTAISTATWGTTKLPVTLRDDEILITEEEPEEDPIYSHEYDTPEEVDFTGKGLTMSGAFIRATREEMQTLLGGKVESSKYHHSSTKIKLNKAIKIVLQDKSEVIIPNAEGYVNMNLSLGKGGVSKFPFKFNLKRASDDWDCDIVL